MLWTLFCFLDRGGLPYQLVKTGKLLCVGLAYEAGGERLPSVFIKLRIPKLICAICYTDFAAVQFGQRRWCVPWRLREEKFSGGIGD